MIRKELEKKLKEHRKEASRLAKDLGYLKRARYLAFYVFIGTGWEERAPKIHFKARGELKNVMCAALEEFKRKNGNGAAQGKYVCVVTALLPNGNPVFIHDKFFKSYLEKYGKPSQPGA
ncbi:MAG: hypothetical protein HYW15_03345 [Candidatus Giovannonibacteria bacterium]|nr:MAG: hypothetical protein HYW15_03345 [Candidatus Giovannonibacteria bacterium]